MKLLPFSKKTTLGLDIGSYSIKAIQLAKEDSSRYRVVSLRVTEIEKESENPHEAIITAIKNSLEGVNPKKTRLVTSLGGSSVLIKQVTFPSSSPKEIESSLKWEAPQYIPLPLDKIELKFQIRRVNEDGKSSEVLLVAVDKGALQRQLEFLKSAGVEPQIIDVNPLALANAFLTFSSKDEDKNVAMIDIGASSTIITIFRKGGFFFSRDISIGGDRFTREIQKTYRLEYLQAERFKKKEEVDLNLIKTVLDQLLLEIRQSLLFFDTRTGHQGYEEIIITGGGARLPGLISYLEKNLNLPIISFNPLSNLKMDFNLSEDEVEKIETQVGVAMGLALRE